MGGSPGGEWYPQTNLKIIVRYISSDIKNWHPWSSRSKIGFWEGLFWEVQAGWYPQIMSKHLSVKYLVFIIIVLCYGFGLNLRLLGTEFVTRDLVQMIIFFVRGQQFLVKTNVSVTQKTQEIICEKIKVKKLYTFTKQINYIPVTKTY